MEEPDAIHPHFRYFVTSLLRCFFQLVRATPSAKNGPAPGTGNAGSAWVFDDGSVVVRAGRGEDYSNRDG